MKTAITFAAGMFIGAAGMLFALAWPEITVSQSDVQFIQAFRQIGCSPYKTDTGALMSGCSTIRQVGLTP